MECTKCHKDIKEPLELYTGEIACPKCKSSLSQYPKVLSATDPRCKELFSLAELYYHYALSKYANLVIPGIVEHSAMSADEMLAKSIAYCQEALKLGHPEALWRMAFFHEKGYMHGDKTETTRYRIAANMYLALASAPEVQFAGYGTTGTADETVSLKRRAADDLFNLVKKIPSHDRKRYTDALIELDYTTKESVQELSSDLSINDVDELINVLSRASSKRKAPIIGILRIKKEHLAHLYSDIIKLASVVNRRLELMFIPLGKDDKYDFRNSVGGNSPYHVMRVSSDAIKNGISLACDKSLENVCVFFFNKDGKHTFYSSSAKKDKLYKTITNDLIDRLISTSPGRSYVFYDDDIYAKNGKIEKIIAEIAAKSEA